MVILSLRVPEEAASRFDAAAAEAGGRAALLRRLVGSVIGDAAPDRNRPAPSRKAGKVAVRLTSGEVAAIDAAAAVMGLPRSVWIAALIRRRLTGKPTLSRPAELAFIGAQMELRRIGVAVIQASRALEAKARAEQPFAAELEVLRGLHVEVRGHIAAMRSGFEGCLAYWTVEP